MITMKENAHYEAKARIKKFQQLRGRICQLKKKNSSTGQEIQVLLKSPSNSFLKELLSRICGKSVEGGKTTRKYPEEVKKFAVTLQLCSTNAYNYVRSCLPNSLPHESVIRSWHEDIDGHQGFTAEAFQALKWEARTAEDAGKPLICSLVFDKMSLRKEISFDGSCYYGYTDLSSSTMDNTEAATQALMMMVVSANKHIKCPIGYFFYPVSVWVSESSSCHYCCNEAPQRGHQDCSSCSWWPNFSSHNVQEAGCKFQPWQPEDYIPSPLWSISMNGSHSGCGSSVEIDTELLGYIRNFEE